MGMEWRNCKLYYYRKKRRGKRVESHYIGRGEVGYSVYQHDRFKKKLASEFKKADLELIQRERETEKVIHTHQNNLRALIYASYLINGFHMHKGQWRRMRHG